MRRSDISQLILFMLAMITFALAEGAGTLIATRSLRSRIEPETDGLGNFIDPATGERFDRNLATTECDVLGMFGLDKSGSMGRDYNQYVIPFVQDILKTFTIGPNDSKFALYNFNSIANKIISLADSQSSNPTALNNALNAEKNTYPSGSTNCESLMQAAVTEFSAIPANIKGAKVLFFPTDGVCDETFYTSRLMTNLRKMGVKIISIPIGSAPDVNFLTQYSDLVVAVSQASKLQNYINQIKEDACVTKSPTKQPTPAPTVHGQCQYTRLNRVPTGTEGPLFALGDIKLNQAQFHARTDLQGSKHFGFHCGLNNQSKKPILGFKVEVIDRATGAKTFREFTVEPNSNEVSLSNFDRKIQPNAQVYGRFIGTGTLEIVISNGNGQVFQAPIVYTLPQDQYFDDEVHVAVGASVKFNALNNPQCSAQLVFPATMSPTKNPTPNPTLRPTPRPTNRPTTNAPTTGSPSQSPSSAPTTSPTVQPEPICDLETLEGFLKCFWWLLIPVLRRRVRLEQQQRQKEPDVFVPPENWRSEEEIAKELMKKFISGIAGKTLAKCNPGRIATTGINTYHSIITDGMMDVKTLPQAIKIINDTLADMVKQNLIDASLVTKVTTQHSLEQELRGQADIYVKHAKSEAERCSKMLKGENKKRERNDRAAELHQNEFKTINLQNLYCCLEVCCKRYPATLEMIKRNIGAPGIGTLALQWQFIGERHSEDSQELWDRKVDLWITSLWFYELPLALASLCDIRPSWDRGDNLYLVALNNLLSLCRTQPIKPKSNITVPSSADLEQPDNRQVETSQGSWLPSFGKQKNNLPVETLVVSQIQIAKVVDKRVETELQRATRERQERVTRGQDGQIGNNAPVMFGSQQGAKRKPPPAPPEKDKKGNNPSKQQQLTVAVVSDTIGQTEFQKRMAAFQKR